MSASGNCRWSPRPRSHGRDGFDATYAAAQAAKAKAETQRKVLAEAKRWVEALPFDARLLLVQPAASGLDLAALRARLAGLREELRRLDGRPPLLPILRPASSATLAIWRDYQRAGARVRAGSTFGCPLADWLRQQPRQRRRLCHRARQCIADDGCDVP